MVSVCVYSKLIFIIIQALLLGQTHGIVHYYSEAGTRTCFYKELNKGSLLIGRYKMEIRQPGEELFYSPQDRNTMGVLIDVEETFDSDHRVVHQKGSPSGQFTFIALDSGEHRICLTPKSFYLKKWYGNSENEVSVRDLKFSQAKVLIDLVIGDSRSIDSRNIDEIKSLYNRIINLNNKLQDIKREQLFIREKEIQFRNQSEKTCDTVVRWLLIQVIAMIFICIYQLVTILRFVLKKKKEE